MPRESRRPGTQKSKRRSRTVCLRCAQWRGGCYSHRCVGPTVRSQAGFTLIEMLVSAGIMCMLVGVLLQFCSVAYTAVRMEGDRSDLQQRLRTAVEPFRRDLLEAGTGPSNGVRGPLVHAFAPLIPGRVGVSGADAELTCRTDRISITSVSAAGSQTRLVAAMASPGAPLRIDGAAAGCPTGNVCGFSAGDRVLVYQPADGDGAYDVFTVAGVDTGQALLTAAAALSRAYSAGSRVVTATQHVYYLDRAGKRLMVYDGDRSDVPLVDHVVDLRITLFGDPSASSVPPPAPGGSSCAYTAGDPPAALLTTLPGAVLVPLAASQITDGPACGQAPNRFDADLLRVRRVRVALRIETEASELRGAGPAFFTRGTAIDGTRLIPDVQLTFDVSPRNMAAASSR